MHNCWAGALEQVTVQRLRANGGNFWLSFFYFFKFIMLLGLWNVDFGGCTKLKILFSLMAVSYVTQVVWKKIKINFILILDGYTLKCVYSYVICKFYKHPAYPVCFSLKTMKATQVKTSRRHCHFVIKRFYGTWFKVILISSCRDKRQTPVAVYCLQIPFSVACLNWMPNNSFLLIIFYLK